MRTTLLRVPMALCVGLFALVALTTPNALRAQPATVSSRQAASQTALASVVAPEFVGVVGGQVAPTEVAVVDGTTAYVGEGKQLVVLDVRDTAQPAERARLPLPAPALDIYVNSGTAYVATQNGLLLLVDVRTPTAPVLRGTYKSPSAFGETGRVATSVFVVGTTAYVTYAVDREGSYRADVQIVDVRTPSAPVQQSTVSPGSGIARDVVVQNSLAYVLFAGTSSGGLAIYDVAKPNAPALRSTFAMQPTQSIAVAGNRAYITVYGDGINQPGLTVVDVTNGAQPRKLGHYVGDFTAVFVRDTLAFVVGQAGVQVLDVRNPAAIAARGAIATSGAANSIFISATHAFVAAQGGLHVIDVMEPEQLRLRNQRVARRVLDAGVNGTTAYLYDVAGDPALQIVDLGTATKPVLRGRLPVSFVIEDIEVVGSTVYLAAGADGVTIVDVSDQNTPVLRGTFDTPGYAYAVHVQNNVAYVADGDAGLQIVNVANPAQPQLLGASDTSGVAVSLDVLNNLVYLGNIAYSDAPPTDAGVQIIDVAQPKTPRVRGTYASLPAHNIEVVNDTAYVAGGTSGLVLLNVRDAARPTLRGATTAVVPLDVKVVGSSAYVATGTDGVQVVNVGDPAKPAYSSTLDVPEPGYAQSINALGDLVLVATDEAGLQMWRVRAPAPQIKTFIPFTRR